MDAYLLGMVTLLVGALVWGLLLAWIASRRGRSQVRWFLGGFLFTIVAVFVGVGLVGFVGLAAPVIALIVVLALPKVGMTCLACGATTTLKSGAPRYCPQCGAERGQAQSPVEGERQSVGASAAPGNAERVVCSHCGSVVRATGNYCLSCGFKFAMPDGSTETTEASGHIAA